MQTARISRFLVSGIAVLVILAIASAPRDATAFPTCYFSRSLTLSEQLDQADTVVRVKWVEATPAKRGLRSSFRRRKRDAADGQTTYEIVNVLKKPFEPPAHNGRQTPTTVCR